MNYVDRPAFREGQVLAASDLQLTVDYPRGELETHASVAHTSGVVDGLTFDIVNAVAPSTGTTVYVTAGLAVDGLGRQLSLATPLPLATAALSGLPAGPYPAYVWYTEAPVASLATSLDPCRTASGDRTRETPAVGVFASDALARAANPNAVCLGYLAWDGTSALQTYSGSEPSVRQGGGVRVHEIVAAEGAVLAHAEDTSATTFSVKGTLCAIAADDGTAPVLAVPGGALEFSAARSAAAASTISLSYAASSATGNELAIDLGNDDPTSAVVVRSQSGTALATIDGTGSVSARAGAFDTMTVSSSVVVETGRSTLTLGATLPSNVAGVTASDTLALAFGTAAGDGVSFVSGGTPVATIDANALTMTAKSVAVGVLDATSGAAGLGITSGADLEIRTSGGDLFLNPGTANVPPFRFTAKGTVVNQNVSPAVDVTPLTLSNAKGSALRLGSLAVAFGTVNATLDPLTQSPAAIDFPLAFAASPSFFVAVCGQDSVTIAAVATSVTPTGASYRIVQLAPASPKDGDAATWSDAKLDVTVSWVALGVAS